MNFEPLFIFSLPRSGSTLLQRMLACHPNIATVSEPWILLPILALLQENCRILAEFSIGSQRRALFDFLSKLPDGKKAYFSAVRKFALELYSRLTSQETKYVLDKTPRYYLIIDEILNTFPNAKRIFLFRHPLATLASMCQALFGGKLMEFGHNIDAFKGPFLLTKAYKKYSKGSFTIHYEKLVQQPSTVIKDLCDYLELEYQSSILENFAKIRIEGIMGDKKCYKSNKIVRHPLERWKEFFASPFRKRFAKRYLSYLGKDIVSIMGYDYDAIIQEIEKIKPTRRLFFKDILGIIKSKMFTLLEYGVIRDRLNRKKKGLDSYPLH